MSRLDDCIYMLKQQGYSAMFTEYVGGDVLRIRISKNGVNLQKDIPLHNIERCILGTEQTKMNILMDMRKELDESLRTNNAPRWNDYQAHALIDISDRLVRYGEDQENESLRVQLRSIATEIRNIIPMEMVRRKGEEK